MVFLVLYVDDILLMGDNVKLLTEVKDWLATQFKMKDLGNANYVLGIQILRDRKNRVIREIVNRGDVTVTKILTLDNLADPFTKTLSEKLFFKHIREIGLKEMPHRL